MKFKTIVIIAVLFGIFYVSYCFGESKKIDNNTLAKDAMIIVFSLQGYLTDIAVMDIDERTKVVIVCLASPEGSSVLQFLALSSVALGILDFNNPDGDVLVVIGKAKWQTTIAVCKRKYPLLEKASKEGDALAIITILGEIWRRVE